MSAPGRVTHRGRVTESGTHRPREQAPRVALGFVHPSEVSALFCSSLTSTLLADGMRGPDSVLTVRGAVISVASGPRIAYARNEVVRAFLKTSIEWLLMVDADMVFNLGNIEALLEAVDPEERPVVGALCFGGGRSGVMFPTLYRLRATSEEQPNPVEIIEDYPEGLCRVDATGAAFLMMHRSVLERMVEKYGEPAPWFVEGTVYKGLSFGEDWAFCMRARELGVPVYVDTRCKVGHVKPMVLSEDSWRRYRIERDEIGDEGIVQRFADRFTNPGDSVAGDPQPSVRKLEVVR